MTKEIQLTQGKVALVDDEDFERLNQWKWNTGKGNGYATRKSWDGKKQKPIFMHRELLQPPSGLEVDHINHNKLDNRKENLRLATRKQNAANRLGKNGGTSKYKCVCISRTTGRWQVIFDKRLIGMFATEEAAAKAYDYSAIRLYGEFANTNFQYTPDEKRRILEIKPYYPSTQEIADKMSELLSNDSTTRLSEIRYRAIEILQKH